MERVWRELQEQGARDRSRALRLRAGAGAAGRRRSSVRRRSARRASSGRRAASKGFGYDPIFVPEGQTRTFGEMTPRRETAADASRARVREIARGAEMSDFGIYVHWPYCAAICPYCDFNVYRARGADNAPLLDGDRSGHRRARRALRQARGGEPFLRRRHALAAARRRDRAADRCGRRERSRWRADCEITLEANPEDARAVRRAGRRRRQPLLHRRAGARRCGAEGARPHARCGVCVARGRGGGGDRRSAFRSI